MNKVIFILSRLVFIQQSIFICRSKLLLHSHDGGKSGDADGKTMEISIQRRITLFFPFFILFCKEIQIYYNVLHVYIHEGVGPIGCISFSPRYYD